MTGFDVKTASSIIAFPPEFWARLSDGRPFLSYDWYRYGETVLHDAEGVYIVLTREGEPVAGASFWFDYRENESYIPALLRAPLKAVLDRWPVMLCQSLLAPATGLILPEEPARREEALSSLIETAEAEARKRRASIIIFDRLAQPDLERKIWPEGYTPIAFAKPGTALDLQPWDDFDTYIRAQRKSAYKDFRRHRNRAADLGIEVAIHDRIVTPLEEAMPLIMNIYNRHDEDFAPWEMRLIENAHAVDTIWLTAHIEDRLVGCGLLLGDQGAYTMDMLGLDEDVQYVYFQLIYAAIRGAIERGAHTIYGGREAYEIKERLGFEIQPNYHAMVKGRNALINRLLRWIIGKMDEDDE